MRRDLSAVQARSEQPDRDVAADAGDGPDRIRGAALIGRWFEVFGEFDDVADEIVFGLRGERAA